MRVDDLTPPTVPAHVPPAGSILDRWPWRLHIGLEFLPASAYVWDDADPDVLYDDDDPDRFVWDAPEIGSGFTDVACDWAGLQIEQAVPDELGLFGATQATLTLANPDGRYTAWTVDGRLVFWAPGRRLCIWVTDPDGEPWWLFSGRVADWRIAADDTVTVTAFDGFAELAAERPAWTPGTAGQTARARIGAIAAEVDYTDPIDGDPGDVNLATGVTDLSPLEEMQHAALSDGGLYYSDADGRLTYRNRLWRAGRADQTTTVVFTDNVCTVPAVVWDVEMAADDDNLATTVELINTAGLRADATTAAPRVYRLTHPEPDLWTTQAEGDALAAYLLAHQSTPHMAVRAFVMYLLDPGQDLWAAGVDLRRGDRIRFLHDFADPNGDPATLDVYLIVAAASHDITPDGGWVVTVNGTRTVDYTTVEMWDDTRFVWDDPDPAAVWRY